MDNRKALGFEDDEKLKCDDSVLEENGKEMVLGVSGSRDDKTIHH